MGLFVRVLALGAFFAGALVLFQSWAANDKAADDKIVTLYKNPACTCCEGYADYLRRNGFNVKVVETDDLAAVNEKYGVPEIMAACHTSIVGGYVIEGHVAVDLVNRLLAEKPHIIGIALPEMSPGTPGMGGQKNETLAVYAIAPGAPVFGTQ